MNTLTKGDWKSAQKIEYIGDFDPDKWPRRRKSSAGQIFEKRILGMSNFDYTKIHKMPEYLPFQKALEVASKIHQRWDPRKNESTSPAHQMLRAVESQFYLTHGEVPCIDMFRCVGTAADEFHGVDCFFCIRGTRQVALVDLTENPEKTVPRSANHIYFHPEDLEESRLREFALKVVQILMSS